MDILPGTSIGGYVLKQFIGSGGMGAVYLAEDQAIGQQVAIKIMRTDSAELLDASAAARTLERFKQEARAVANLDHLHILPLYRYGEERTGTGQRAYMVMQYRPEGSLWDWLRRRGGMSGGIGRSSLLSPVLPDSWPLRLAEANEYLQQAASALQYAHDRGIIHRDIKPANFLLRVDNGNTVHLLLSDFGLAKFFASSSATSTILGTPTYMAPEQFEGNAGPESDQYALAVMIYLLLAGRPPFEGEPLRLMHAHITEAPPPIRSFAPSLPQGVELALTKALAKKPADRYPSISDFAHAFQTAASEQLHTISPAAYSYNTSRQTPDNAPTVTQPWGRSAPSSPSSPTPSLPGRPFSLSAGDNGNNAPTVAQPFRSSDAAPSAAQARWETPVPSLATNTPGSFDEDNAPTVAQPFLSGPQGWPAFDSSLPEAAPVSPDAQTGTQKVSRRGVLALVAGGAAAIILGGGGAYLYLHSATSTATNATNPAATSTTSTNTTTNTNGAIVLSGHQDMVTSVNWSPDGTQLVSTSRDGTARIWSLANRQSTATYTGHQGAVLTAAWRPDGYLLASGGADQSVQIWIPTGNTQHAFLNLGSPVSSVSWAANNVILAAGTLGSGTDEISLRTGRVVKSAQNFIIHALAFSPDGHQLALAFDNGDISIYDTTTRHARTFHRHKGATLCLAWSSDGTQIASGGADNTARIMNASTGRPLKVLQHHAPVNGVSWEPTGTTRLATACEDGLVRLWDVSGGGHTSYKASAPLTSVSWNANGLAAGSANHTVLIWKV
ncbi:MAG TPA: serine/threonine-protein kinase [Ktedonobacteraceae bacterium]|nr:serine/threonine-protein kinase [Ktedonobacteraceae bacterium]